MGPLPLPLVRGGREDPDTGDTGPTAKQPLPNPTATCAPTPGSKPTSPASKTKAENRFPFAKFAPNRLWLHIVALADTLVRWFQKLSLPKHHPLARAKPKTLRPNLWHIPGVIARHSRQTTLRIPATWPTATRGGHGLSLLVKPTNIGGRLSKTWSQRIRVSGKETNLGLGSFPAVTLAEARRRAVHNSQEIEEGRHPRARSIPTFQQAADTVIEIHSAKWRPNSKTRQGWVSSLEDLCVPDDRGQGGRRDHIGGCDGLFIADLVHESRHRQAAAAAGRHRYEMGDSGGSPAG